MNSTSASLLQRLHQPEAAEAWARFVKLYTPLLFFWARRLARLDADAADLVQDVFAILVQKLPDFQYDQGKGFRNWLRTVLLSKVAPRRAPATRRCSDTAVPTERWPSWPRRRTRTHSARRSIAGTWCSAPWN